MPLSRLILLRHGKAEHRAPSGEDFDRALTERGHADSRETGRRLAAAGFIPDVALVSSARRTEQTWAEASAAFPKVPAEFTRELFHADAALMWDSAQAADAASVMIVGHNPGMHALVFELLQRSEAAADHIRAAHAGFPPASAAVFSFEAGRPVCEAFFTRKDAAGE